jgi:hypothetical protein
MEGLTHLSSAYGVPYAAGGLTLALYLALRKVWSQQEDLIASVFAAAAIITYYWFRLPAMFGIGAPEMAIVVDVSGWLPVWSATALRIFELTAFSWLMVGRTGKRRAWELPPPIADKSSDPTSVGEPTSYMAPSYLMRSKATSSSSG